MAEFRSPHHPFDVGSTASLRQALPTSDAAMALSWAGWARVAPDSLAAGTCRPNRTERADLRGRGCRSTTRALAGLPMMPFARRAAEACRVMHLARRPASWLAPKAVKRAGFWQGWKLQRDALVPPLSSAASSSAARLPAVEVTPGDDRQTQTSHWGCLRSGSRLSLQPR